MTAATKKQFNSELAEDIEMLARFSETDQGVTRTAWSPSLRAAYDWLSERARHADLGSSIDAAGNLRLEWSPTVASRILVGSHLDTVPCGGRYDGALGVLGGLDAARKLRSAGLATSFPLSVVAFMDEEGTRFGTALFGSRAFVGEALSEFLGRTDAAGMTLAEAMASQGCSTERLPTACRVRDVDAYLELHIEQGPVLEHERADIGIVSAIVGLVGFQVRLSGQANHAGTTPMKLRRDALAGAARALCELRDIAVRTPGMTSNVGTISVEPGGKNVIPGTCDLSIDVRAATADVFEGLETTVRAVLGRVSAEEGLEVELSELYRLPPIELDTGLSDLLERAADAVGASYIRMPSGAGHDAMILGRHVASAMLFVPSRGGVSHSPDEYTSPAQCELGARVLAKALQLIAVSSRR